MTRRKRPPRRAQGANRDGRWCSFCNQPLIWATTINERRIPLDPEPNPAGNFATYKDSEGIFRAYRADPEQPAKAWETVYMPHAATCPARQRANSSAT